MLSGNLDMPAAEPDTPASGALPPQTSKGDAKIVLDDGQTVQVHSALLALGSNVLEEALQLAQADGRDGSVRVPLPSTSFEELQALLRALYARRIESHLIRVPSEELCLLSSVCHRFNFEDLLSIIDQALARHAGHEELAEELRSQIQVEQYLKPDNAAALYWDARSKGLKSFEAACGSYIGAHVKEVADASPSDALGPILRHLSKHPKPWGNDVEHVIAELKLAMGPLGIGIASGLPALLATRSTFGMLWTSSGHYCSLEPGRRDVVVWWIQHDTVSAVW